MELYGQDAELRLLGSLVAGLEHRTMIDVGAERGTLASAMLSTPLEKLYAFEPHPANVALLRAQFEGDTRVVVYDHALSDSDGSGQLHVSSEPDGTPLPFGHTLLERRDTEAITWRETLTVTRRSLQSLIDAGEIPSRVGILKIDTEGHDLAVAQGMGELQADIVMVEHWTDLPNGLGVCPWSIDEMAETMRARGFSHFAFIVHRGEFVTLKWDDGIVERGAMGNLFFLHESKLGQLLPAVLECAGRLAEGAVRLGQTHMRAASERLALVDGLKRAADERLALVDELQHICSERLALVNELTRVADERLALVGELTQVADERLTRLNTLQALADARLLELQAAQAPLSSKST